MKEPTTGEARRVRVRGVVQGVGFRPFVYRMARQHGLAGWVRNGPDGVEIHIEGTADRLGAFVVALGTPPPAAVVAGVEVAAVPPEGFTGFTLRPSTDAAPPTLRITPDLAVCDACLAELFDPADRRFHYPYLNCTDCGPRYSIVEALPYDRPNTTMRAWPMCPACAAEYHDPADRRFHAQPTACPVCGPHFVLLENDAKNDAATAHGEAALVRAVGLLAEGQIVAVKGLGGYHLACDAQNAEAVAALRARKFRKEKPFALLVPSAEAADALVVLSEVARALLLSTPRPIVLAPARARLPGVAPGNGDLGVMLPSTPLHHLLFALGAPRVLVMTSANRSSEPLAFRDDEARDRLAGLADAFLVGARPIARRVDDAIACDGPFGPMLLRRARGYAPGVVARLPGTRPLLALGADLKNTVTLAIDGQAFMSQHLGDLTHYPAFAAFRETLDDLLGMYRLHAADVTVVHDRHPQYASTAHALEMPGEKIAVQHHRAHIAAVLAERGAWDKSVVGFAFDGTGYGDDGTLWGGEVFVGGLTAGLRRVAHLRPARLPGGDAAARVPVQAAAGFLWDLNLGLDLTAPPFAFPDRYRQARALLAQNLRVFPTTSVGRFFDAVAALLGFTRPVTFQGQAAIWLEQRARTGTPGTGYPFPDFDHRPLFDALLRDRQRGRRVEDIACDVHRALAHTVVAVGRREAEAHRLDTLVLSGGVFQNLLLLDEIKAACPPHLAVWTHRHVPPNDGGISLGQAALAAMRRA